MKHRAYPIDKDSDVLEIWTRHPDASKIYRDGRFFVTTEFNVETETWEILKVGRLQEAIEIATRPVPKVWKDGKQFSRSRPE